MSGELVKIAVVQRSPVLLDRDEGSTCVGTVLGWEQCRARSRFALLGLSLT